MLLNVQNVPDIFVGLVKSAETNTQSEQTLAKTIETMCDDRGGEQNRTVSYLTTPVLVWNQC